jgi:hypothetical protein
MAELHTATKQMQQHRLPKQKFGLYREATEIACMRKAPVYELVKTLTTGEVKMLRKRSESAGAAYIGLLDILVAAPANNETETKSLFARQFNGIDYTETKSYLYKYLLRHLTAQEQPPNTFAQINYSFATAEMLFSRGLTDEAVSVFKQANKLAQHEGFYQLSVVAIRRIKNLKLKTMRTSRDYEEIQQLHEQEKTALKNDSDVSEAMMLYTAFLQLTEKYGGPVNKKVTARYQSLMQHPLVKQRQQVQSQQAGIILFDMVTNYYRLFGQNDLCLKEYRTELARYTPALLKNPYYAYRNIFMLHNLTGSFATGKDVQKYSQLLSKAPTPDAKTVYYKQLFMLHARLNGPVAPTPVVTRLMADVKRQLADGRMAERTREKLNLYTNTLQYLLACRQYGFAEDMVLPALNDKELEETLPAEFNSLRLFYLAVLYSLEKYDAMEPVNRATRYALKARGLENEVSLQVLNLFGALMRNKGTGKLQPVIQKLKAMLNDVPNYSYQQWGIHAFLESVWFRDILAKR